MASSPLLLHEITSYCRVTGIAVGPGRYSLPGSLTAWALGITEPDPLQHGLLFEVTRALPQDRSTSSISASAAFARSWSGMRHTRSSSSRTTPAALPASRRSRSVPRPCRPRGRVHDQPAAGEVRIDPYAWTELDELANVGELGDGDRHAIFSQLGWRDVRLIFELDRPWLADAFGEVRPDSFEDVIATGPCAAHARSSSACSTITSRHDADAGCRSIRSSTRSSIRHTTSLSGRSRSSRSFTASVDSIGSTKTGYTDDSEPASTALDELLTEFSAGAARQRIAAADAAQIFERVAREAPCAFLKAAAVPIGYTMLLRYLSKR